MGQCERSDAARQRRRHRLRLNDRRDSIPDGDGRRLPDAGNTDGCTSGALAALRTAGMRVEPTDDGLLLVDPPHIAAHITETLARDHLWVTEMRPQELSLEDVFLELTESAR